ncbi:hypothetical protein IQ268_31295 [Oculatella sp. LEGE 06141]|uniref:hypothetical protein n=1 Tax=Oculatella sp. LEGE 06141 TaxID=1828648 RepID=UPI0018821743|nr:hypothetical protein [Oculatella sp. LEGE 06141]MBE9183022.1 hypothetical protein [Oculatella sp. LEGE 06141]
MYLTLIINSVVCVLGTIFGLLFAGGSIISIANMTVPWVGFLLVAALLVPVMFVVSGIGTWLTYTQGFTQVTIGLIALPWLYGVVFILLMLVSFN